MTDGEQELYDLQKTLADYARVSKKTNAEVLAKKSRDLGIQLYRQFSARKWGGDGKKKAGLAKAEMEARRARGEGTIVRPDILRQYREALAALGPSTRKRKGRSARQNLWQKAVGQEVKKRQAGIGALAASFLLFRRRTNSTGTRFSVNRNRVVIGRFDLKEESARITGFAEGLGKLDQRHGLVSRAIAFVRGDTEAYLLRKQLEALKREIK